MKVLSDGSVREVMQDLGRKFEQSDSWKASMAERLGSTYPPFHGSRGAAGIAAPKRERFARESYSWLQWRFT